MSDSVVTPEVLVSGLIFSECPRWHRGELFIVDMHARQVLAVTPAGETRIVAELPCTPGGLGWLPDGTLLVVAQEQRQVLRADADGLHVHADLGDSGDSPLNDMWVDADGYAFVGEMGFDVYAVLHPAPGQEPAAIKPGRLFCIDPVGNGRVATDAPMLFPNGIVESPTTGRILAAQSFGFALSEFDRDADGTLTLVSTAQLTFAPDGIAADAEGAVWVADPAGGRAVRMTPQGEELQVVTTGQQCLAVTLGGEDGRTLFLCTSPGTDPEENRRVRGSRVEVVTVEVPAP